MVDEVDRRLSSVADLRYRCGNVSLICVNCSLPTAYE